eukprot:jgi/Ulvmu1/6119/UM027_0097.1
MWARSALQMLHASRSLAVPASSIYQACCTRAYGSDAEPLLLRDYLYEHLSGKNSGYFSQTESPIGRLRQPISFNLLLGEAGWRAKQQELYQKLKRSWLTPVELFQPWYAQAVAQFIVRHHTKRRPSHPLTIVEVGGGQGTLAKGILDFLHEKHPKLYAEASYTAIDASPHLVEVQHRRLKKHGTAFQAVVGDARASEPWKRCRQVYTYVVAMEVLDNLPHDCVMRDGPEGPWQEVVVQRGAAGGCELGRRELQDGLVTQALHAADWGQSAAGEGAPSSTQSMWGRMLDAVAGVGSSAGAGASDRDTVYLPTGSLQLFRSMHAALPQHHLLAADFAYFTESEVKVRGVNAPIVSSTAHGRSVDYDNFLQPPGSVDVFFPTDFEAAKRLWHAAAGLQGRGARGTSVVPSSAFLNVYANTRKTKTLTAYNPLIDDFSNTSFLLAEAAVS